MRAALVGVALLLALAGCGGERPGRAEADNRLPAVTLPGYADAAPVDLATLRGPAVLTLWAGWCAPCLRELPIFEEFHRAYGADVRVLGVNWQETRPAAAAQLAERLSFPSVVDAEGRIVGNALPQLIMLDADGAIVYRAFVEVETLGELEKLVTEELGVSL